MPTLPTRHRIDRDDLTLAADVFENTDTDGTAILLHGGGQTRQSWRATARTIAGSVMTAVSVDLRGHGDSGWSATGDYSLDALVDDIDVLGRTFPDPVLIGASLSGLMSSTVSACSPRRAHSRCRSC
ncbi:MULTISPECIES: alpha/beta fold hydrolase [Gordonia]|jgi:pimeloyl-ACP methyl ester carboxylesterase|uniref:alpha/beta fold hydrolase n=1 Tax=Gordonia TaxID=2053 RepID=UPI002AFE2A00|nr:alpha/beta fold hydrolase [Gordonia pseudamarae]